MMTNKPPTLPILAFPDPILLQKSKPIPSGGEESQTNIAELAAAMRATMLAASGVGLAAPQVGHSIRLIIADVSPNKDAPLAVVNPRIIKAEGRQTSEEGCLSLPGGLTAPVERAARVTVDGADLQGRRFSIDAEGLLAVCLQHEIDHLNGVLFFHRISRLRRARLLAKYNKARREEEKTANPDALPD
jgi:peptide deformylase